MEPERLSREVTTELNEPENELWLSPISILETIILAEKGRIVLDDSPEKWIRNALNLTPCRQAMLSHEVAILSRSINLPHQDPVDRFIAASAQVYDLALITADQNLIAGATNYSVFPNL